MNVPQLNPLFPIPVVQRKEVLRPSPDLNFLSHLNYSDDKYRDAIRHEIREKWVKLNKGEIRDPITNEGGYRKITEQVHFKYHQLHREHRARTLLWLQSERTLNLLRSKGQIPASTQDQLDQAMMNFIQRVKVENFPEIDESLQLGPIEYFELARPQLVADYGYPFYSTVVDQDVKPEKIIGINTDFWAAFMGGDKRLGHDLVFFVPESRFYFFDLVAGCYAPTSEEKVRLVASQALQQRAWGQESSLATTFLVNFRTKKVMDEIILKAKAILAAEAGFFVGPDARPRLGAANAVDVTTMVDAFVKDYVEQADGEVLTLGECLLQLGTATGITAERKNLRTKVKAVIRSVHGKGLRNDLILPNGHGCNGWKGLRLRVRAVAAENNQEETHFTRCPDDSVPSGAVSAEPSKELVLVS